MKVTGQVFKEGPGQFHAGVFCQWAGEVEFELTEAKRLGRVAFHGDRRTFLVAELQDGRLAQVMVTKQAVEHQKELKKMLDKMPRAWVSGRAAFGITWQESQGAK